jgi:structural maintenance of chromosome 3 (chondroitin sulfate proteoglycan 6)
VVSIKRSITAKEDKYLLDGKHVTRTDVANLLESAGFSKSNPYYIVPQGKVMALSQLREPEYLDLLREVAGTRVYDERRKESLKMMEESKQRIAKVDEVLAYIEERLQELEQDTRELGEYMALDKEKRCLE